MRTIPFVQGERHGVVLWLDRAGNVLKERYFWKDELLQTREEYLEKLLNGRRPQ